MSETAIATIPQDQIDRIHIIGEMVITSAVMEKEAIDGLTFIQSIKRSLEKSRKELVSPLNEKVKQINSSFKLLLTPIEQSEGKVKNGLLDWRRKEAERIRIEQEHIARENAERERLVREAEEVERVRVEMQSKAEAEEAGLTSEEAEEHVRSEVANVSVESPTIEALPAQAPATVKSSIGSATIRKVWTFKIDDPNLIPRAYLSINEGNIREAIRAGVREIPGVRIYQREEIAGRSSR